MTRHSTMLVGPTGGGKTVIITTLVKAQSDLGLPTKLTVLNPKVIFVTIKYFIIETKIEQDRILSRISIFYNIEHEIFNITTVLLFQACSVIELYGILDPVTRDWTDGLYSRIFREMNR